MYLITIAMQLIIIYNIQSEAQNDAQACNNCCTAGIPGLPGNHGNAGAPGPIGPTGVPGNKGEQGPTGLQGNKGEQGPRGLPGDRGHQGNKGDTGTKGSNGIPGKLGPIGQKGETGSTGLQGNKGEQGPRGIQGNKGHVGTKGSNGIPGQVGPTGQKGEIGAAGEKGEKGQKGEQATQKNSAFSVSFISNPGRATGILKYDKITTNVGNHYNLGTGKFVCVIPGTYVFQVASMKSTGSGALITEIRKNGVTVVSAWMEVDDGRNSASTMTVLELVANDEVWTQPYSSSYNYYYCDSMKGCSFSGFLLYAS